MKSKPKLQYGILDDFDEVIRWTFNKPVDRKYITRKVQRKTPWEVASELGEGLF